MKKFMFELSDVEKDDGCYKVLGRNIGDEQIVLGDILYGLKVTRIEVFNQSELPLDAAYGGRLTLSYEHRPKYGNQHAFLVSIEQAG